MMKFHKLLEPDSQPWNKPITSNCSGSFASWFQD